MQLYYQKIGTGSKTVVILHGVFGSSDNWLTIAKALSQSDHTVYLLDQRNHGQSPWSEEWDYEVMSQDLHEFVSAHQLHDIVLVGHSMGGKAAMYYAGRYYPSQVRKLVVVDIAPRQYGLHNLEIARALAEMDLTQVQDRKQADQMLALRVPELGTRQFLLKNLYRDAHNAFRWRLNLRVICQKMANILVALPEHLQFEGDTLFIRGGKSGYIRESDMPAILAHFPNAKLHTIDEAGHWVHAEQPQAILAVIQGFLAQ